MVTLSQYKELYITSNPKLDSLEVVQLYETIVIGADPVRENAEANYDLTQVLKLTGYF